MKESFRLTRENLIDFPVWFTPVQSIRQVDQDATMVLPFIEELFSMEDSSESKVIVGTCPCRNLIGFSPIVRAKFSPDMGPSLLGYISWSVCHDVSALQPVVFLGAKTVRLYQSEKPLTEELGFARSILGPAAFPISVVSEGVCGLPSVCIVLRGIYFLPESDHLSLAESFVVP